ncbi:MAG: hypothetical protein QG614_358 [Patescibacteria group bacterium]|nr:hypothetical protein [Patescibacteria group bacterium]
MNKEIKKNSNAIAIILGSIIIAASIVFGLKTYNGSSSANSGFVDPDSIYSGTTFRPEEYLYGKGDKKVVLVEFSDLECPFCKQLHNQTMPEIYKNYSDKLDIVFKHFPLPFHTKAPAEAVATMCARDQGGQEAYRNFIEEIYRVTEGNDTLDPAKLPEIAKNLNLDVNKFNECIVNASSTQEKMNQIAVDIQDGTSANISGTPGTLVLIKTDGEYRIFTTVEGARDYSYFSRIIDQALKQK